MSAQLLGGRCILKTKPAVAGIGLRDRTRFLLSLGPWTGYLAFWSFLLLIPKVGVATPPSRLSGKANKKQDKDYSRYSLALKKKKREASRTQASLGITGSSAGSNT